MKKQYIAPHVTIVRVRTNKLIGASSNSQLFSEDGEQGIIETNDEDAIHSGMSRQSNWEEE